MRKKIKDGLEKKLDEIREKHTKGQMPKQALAKLIKEITKREIKPGGPYKNNLGIIDRRLNQKIFLFLKSLGLDLPALNDFLKIKSEKNIKIAQKKTPLRHEIKNIITLIPKELPELKKQTTKELAKAITKTAKGNKDGQMFLMPHLFFQSIKKDGGKISKNFLNQMGLANAFFWTSFIIYDDFWDEDEAAKPELLPLANTMSRYFFSFFDNIFKEDKAYHNFFKESLSKLDEANFFEITQCRQMKARDFGDMSLKFYPSIGHLFGPLAILLQLGYKFKDQETQKTISFFKNYLIARQLSDDMHDVEEDFKRGHLSLAVNELLIDAKGKNIEDFSKRNYLFWTKTIDKLCAKSFKLIKAARNDLKHNKAISKPQALNKLLDDLENSAKTALCERDERLEFAENLASS